MGYTHYWKEPSQENITVDEWNAFLQDCSMILAAGAGLGIVADGMGEGLIELSNVRKNGIQFNGWGDDAHETCTFPPFERIGKDFEFCKTAMKPYDEYVTACLTVLNSYFGVAVDVSSDGYPHEWEDGKNLAERILNREFENARGQDIRAISEG